MHFVQISESKHTCTSKCTESNDYLNLMSKLEYLLVILSFHILSDLGSISFGLLTDLVQERIWILRDTQISMDSSQSNAHNFGYTEETKRFFHPYLNNAHSTPLFLLFSN